MQRTILITGCSSGIGRAAAHVMRVRGWRVLATARREADLATLTGAGLEAVRLDYADPDSVRACAEQVLTATGGRIDALFNNGAYGQPGAVEDLEPDVLRRQFEANFFCWHDLTRRMLPAMRTRGAGRIVHCSSVLGLVGLKFRGAYVASKFALEGLADCLRLELRGTGIFVSLIEPGPIATRFTANALKAFEDNIDAERSVFREVYARRRSQLEKGGATRFKLPPEAVVECLVHAVESRRPKPRYRVTTPTHAMAVLKRLLPTRLLDAAAAKISDSG
jgi:NAD(P)-dependent dehydrogenase (short-subunit alcohol dehydrogenase family)